MIMTVNKKFQQICIKLYICGLNKDILNIGILNVFKLVFYSNDYHINCLAVFYTLLL